MLLDVTSGTHTLLTDVHEILSDFPAFFRPIFTKFDRGDLHKHLLSICKHREYRRRDGRTFLTPINKITFKRITSKLFLSRWTNTSVKICVLCHEVDHLRLFFLPPHDVLLLWLSHTTGYKHSPQFSLASGRQQLTPPFNKLNSWQF